MLVEPPPHPHDTYSFPCFSIFSPEPVEKVEELDQDADKPEIFERPPSPLKEVIQKPPQLYEDFLEILQERIKPSPSCKKLTIEHQEGLISIIFSEVYTRWHSLCQAINDPHLALRQNKEVHILLFINVVEICQELFEKYLDKIDKMNNKGVFSRSVNVSRIKGCLIAEASRALNIHRLRQKILHDFKNVNSTTVPCTQRSGREAEMEGEDLICYFDRVLTRTTSLSVDPSLVRKMSSIESKLRLSKSGSESSYGETNQLVKPKPTFLDTVLEAVESPHKVLSSVVSAADSQEDSVAFRHADLEFLLSENRACAAPVAGDEEELPAVLQASTRAPARAHRSAPASQLSSRPSLTSHTSLPAPDLPIQPAITVRTMPDKTVVKTSDIRVSERVPQSDMILELSPCLYNELKNDIDESDISFLDRNLFLGQEIRDVYSEIYKTIEHDHLKFTSQMEAPCSSLPRETTFFNSGLMRKKKLKNRRVNERIRVQSTAPWGDGTREQWESNVHFQGLDHAPSASEVFPSQLIKVPVFSDWDTNNFKPVETKGSSREGKSYSNWLHWWRGVLSAEDYLKYMSLRESDYLALIFHLYDSEEEVDSSDERDMELEKELGKEKEKRDGLLKAMLEEKNKVTPGFWNANAVLMGGLGQDPDFEDGSTLAGDLTPEFLSQVAQSNTNLKRIQGARTRSADSSGTVAPAKSIMSRGSRAVVPTVSGDITSTSSAPGMESKLLQERLNNIWNKLEMPHECKIDMTIKYCRFDAKSMKSVVDYWESACSSISSREKLIMELEIFEKDASDPRRLFGKASKGSRLEEEKKRSALYRRLKKCEKQVRVTISRVEEKLGDTVTYQGRGYLGKMSRDTTEMLYWLQQERRQAALEAGGMVMIDLPPVSPISLV